MFFFSRKTKNMSIRLKNGKSCARPSITFTTEGARSQEQRKVTGAIYISDS
ncbi:hypothetical protein LguiA_004710 [Lonicera macranthoides]